MAVKVTAYCMKCREKREIKDPVAITHPNGKAAITGTCSVCGTKIFRMGSIEGVGPAVASKSKAKAAAKPAVQTEAEAPAAGKRTKVSVS